MNDIKLCKKVWQDPVYFLAFGFGTGLLPKVPGTFGTLAGILVYLLIAKCSWWVYLLFTVVAFFVGVFISDKVSSDLKVHDHSGIVWDEVVGFLITMFLVPFSLTSILIGFVLFRIFDILKPWPISYVDEKVKGGLGVMLDDVIAAVFAWFILQIIARSFM